MPKINFTKEDETRMSNLAVQFLFAGTEWKTTVGTNTDLYELIHTTSINTLKEHYKMYKRQLEKLDTDDRWGNNAINSCKIKLMSDKKEFIELLIGYKLFKQQEEEIVKEKLELAKQISALEDSMKTPEQRLAELKAKQAAL
jgi:chromosome segregation ATPase